MKDFDLKSYHIRAMNTSSEKEKAAINQELKDLYESLPYEDKKGFNEQLQTFLIKEMAVINSFYQTTKEDNLN